MHLHDSDLAQPFFDALVRGSHDMQADPYDPEILQILADATGQDLEVLESNPVTAAMDAVIDQRYLVVPFPASEAGVRSVPAAVDLADQLTDLTGQD